MGRNNRGPWQHGIMMPAEVHIPNVEGGGHQFNIAVRFRVVGIAGGGVAAGGKLTKVELTSEVLERTAARAKAPHETMPRMKILN